MVCLLLVYEVLLICFLVFFCLFVVIPFCLFTLVRYLLFFFNLIWFVYFVCLLLSVSGWLKDSDHELIRRVSLRIEDVTGLTMDTAEELQVWNKDTSKTH